MPLIVNRRVLLLGVVACAGVPAGGSATEPEPQRVPIEIVEEALELRAAIRIGNPQGDVTLVEFFDYNCPWCRRSAQDLPALLAADPDLAYVLVNFPVLGAPSVEASRAALALFERDGPEGYLGLHYRLFGLRGPVNGSRVLNEVEAIGADRDQVSRLADSELVRRSVEEALRVGNSLGLTATPSFLLGPEAYLGALPLDTKRRLIANVRS